MKHAAYLLALALTPALAQSSQTAQPSQAAQAPQTVAVPREKINLSCADTYFKTVRQNFLLVDETYPRCTLRLPLALHDRWPGQRTFYFIPRVSASLYARKTGGGKWIPLSPLVNLGSDPMHRAVPSRQYAAVELTGTLGKLGDAAGDLKPDLVSAGGKLTVCVAPVYKGEAPCTTFDITARYKVYVRE